MHNARKGTVAHYRVAAKRLNGRELPRGVFSAATPLRESTGHYLTLSRSTAFLCSPS